MQASLHHSSDANVIWSVDTIMLWICEGCETDVSLITVIIIIIIVLFEMRKHKLIISIYNCWL